MNYHIGQRVNRLEQRVSVGATVINIFDQPDETQSLELAYDEGGSGWWPATCVEPVSAT